MQDYVFRQIGESIGMPPLFIIDLRPVSWVMCIVTNHEIAEQISRSSKALPYSTPKSPTMGAFEPILGQHSIVSTQVRSRFLLPLKRVVLSTTDLSEK